MIKKKQVKHQVFLKLEHNKKIKFKLKKNFNHFQINIKFQDLMLIVIHHMNNLVIDQLKKIYKILLIII